MKIFIILLFTSIIAFGQNWKKHRTCFSKAKIHRGQCQAILFNQDKRITRRNKLKHQESSICKVSKFKYDFHFYFKNQSITIQDVDIRKFLHRDFDERRTNKSVNCLRKLNMHFAEFNRKAKVFHPCKSNQKSLSQVHIINNCRELGNYEFKFFNNKSLDFKGHTLFTKDFYEQILKDYTKNYGQELDIEDSQIGYTKAHFFQTEKEKTKGNFYLMKPAPNYSALQVKNRCTVKELEMLSPSNSNIIKEGTITVFKGKIPYNEFDKEVAIKSGFSRRHEPLSYIRTPCNKDKNFNEQLKLSAPIGIHKYSNYSSDEEVWSNLRCQYIPYNFKSYDQFIKYNTAFSAFEVDGLYTGKRSNGGSKSNRNGSRWNAS